MCRTHAGKLVGETLYNVFLEDTDGVAAIPQWKKIELQKWSDLVTRNSKIEPIELEKYG